MKKNLLFIVFLFGLVSCNSKYKDKKINYLYERINSLKAEIRIKDTIIDTLRLTIETKDKELRKEISKQEQGIVINGVTWATRNLDKSGSFAATPESSGEFYNWNEKEPYPHWTFRNCCSYEMWQKSNNPCPEGWRVPTLKEIKSLLNPKKVSSEWTVQNAVNGRKFTDLKTKNSIFLPAADCSFDVYKNDTYSNFRQRGMVGYYWTNKLSDNHDGSAYSLTFEDWEIRIEDINSNNGFSVRCVKQTADFIEPEEPPRDLSGRNPRL